MHWVLIVYFLASQQETMTLIFDGRCVTRYGYSHEVVRRNDVPQNFGTVWNSLVKGVLSLVFVIQVQVSECEKYQLVIGTSCV